MEVWKRFVGHQVEFRKPGYVDLPWEKGKLIDVKAGLVPALDELIVQSEKGVSVKILRTQAHAYLVLLRQVQSV